MVIIEEIRASRQGALIRPYKEKRYTQLNQPQPKVTNSYADQGKHRNMYVPGNDSSAH